MNSKINCSDQTLKMYLQEIGSIPILSNKLTLEYFAKLNNTLAKLSNVEDENIKDNLQAECNRLRNQIVEGHLRLVVSIAKNYKYTTFDLLDLIQEGNKGLIRATYKYIPNPTTKFTTYATYWIRQSINQLVYIQKSLINLPLYLSDDIRRVNRAIANFNGNYTIQDIAKATGFSVEKIKKCLKVPNTILSTDIIPDDVIDFFADKNNASNNNLENTIIKKVMAENIDHILSLCLSKKEEIIIRMRFGIPKKGVVDFPYGQKYSLEETGKVVGWPRQKVETMEKTILVKITEYIKKYGWENYFHDSDNIRFEDILRVDKEEVLVKIAKLSQDEQTSLYTRFGKNLDECNAVSTTVYMTSYQAIKKLRRMLDNPDYQPRSKAKSVTVITTDDGRKNISYLKDKLDCTDSDIYNLIFNIITDPKFQNLFKYFGYDLSKPLNELTLSADDYQTLEYFCFILNNKLKNLSPMRYLKDILKLDDMEVTYLSLDKYQPSHKVIAKMFGENYTSEANNIYELSGKERYSFYKALHVYYEKILRLRRKSLGKQRVATPLKNPIFKKLVNLLPKEYQLITALRLGLYDGYIHTMKDICIILSLEEDEAFAKTDIGISLYNDLVSKYQEQYKELREESYQILQLLP